MDILGQDGQGQADGEVDPKLSAVKLMMFRALAF